MRRLILLNDFLLTTGNSSRETNAPWFFSSAIVSRKTSALSRRPSAWYDPAGSRFIEHTLFSTVSGLCCSQSAHQQSTNRTVPARTAAVVASVNPMRWWKYGSRFPGQCTDRGFCMVTLSISAAAMVENADACWNGYTRHSLCRQWFYDRRITLGLCSQKMNPACSWSKCSTCHLRCRLPLLRQTLVPSSLLYQTAKLVWHSQTL